MAVYTIRMAILSPAGLTTGTAASTTVKIIGYETLTITDNDTVFNDDNSGFGGVVDSNGQQTDATYGAISLHSFRTTTILGTTREIHMVVNTAGTGVKNVIGIVFRAEDGPAPPVNTTFQFGSTTGGSAGQFSYDGLTCFAEGTLIDTESGPVAVEHLTLDSLVRTEDGGSALPLWIGSFELGSRKEGIAIRIEKGALGPNLPYRDLVVTRQHRMVIGTPGAQRPAGASEVLVPAAKMLKIPGVDIAKVAPTTRFYHILFERHEVIRANGAKTESFYPGREALRMVGTETARHIQTLVGEYGIEFILNNPARPIVDGREARDLVNSLLDAQRGSPMTGACQPEGSLELS
ncbi:MAG: Hint domain-containing protein [Rhodobacteraceae bacterium]|nr:Hint domain-containing protein [Paracoccaceae bacterium]